MRSSQFAGEMIDAQGPVEVVAYLLHGSNDAIRITSKGDEVTEPCTLFSHQQTNDDFSSYKRRQYTRL